MNKTDLINSLVEETTLPKKDIIHVLNAYNNIVERTLKNGEKVQWSGFGTFLITKREPRKGINPSTKEVIDLPASFVAKFRPGKKLKKAVQSVR